MEEVGVGVHWANPQVPDTAEEMEVPIADRIITRVTVVPTSYRRSITQFLHNNHNRGMGRPVVVVVGEGEGLGLGV